MSSSNPYERTIKNIEDRLAENEQRKAELQQQNQRARRAASLAGVASLLGEIHKAYSYQRGIAPMQLPDFSEKARQRLDKAQAALDANRDQATNLYIALANRADADRQYGLQVQRLRYAMDKDKRDEEYRNKKLDLDTKQFEAQLEYQQQKDATDAEQTKAQADIQQQSLTLQQQQFNRQQLDDYTTFSLGHNFGSVKIRKDSLNAANLANVYARIPEKYRQSKGSAITVTDPITGRQAISGYNLPSVDDMAKDIGNFLGKTFDLSTPDGRMFSAQQSAARTAISNLGTPATNNSFY